MKNKNRTRSRQVLPRKANTIRSIAILAMMCVGLVTTTALAEENLLQLAREISEEGAHAAAALEYRRLALRSSEPDAHAGFAWAAAYEYNRAGIWEVSDKMLDSAEDADKSLKLPALILRAENAEARKNPEEAGFYWQSVQRSRAAPDNMRLYAARRFAAVQVDLGRAEIAANALSDAPGDNTAGQVALAEYIRGRDKKPLLGGMLGIIPGMGYAYAGEYANAARSLLLNSLFIFGMIHTAEREQWGAFAAISFFEITFYSGSIYGGLDATHRYNRRRLENCKKQIIGNAGFKPDLQQLPLVMLRFEF